MLVRRYSFLSYVSCDIILGMITDQDVEKLKGTFATKEDLSNLETKVDGLTEMVQGLAVGVDKLVKAEESRQIEDASMKVKTDRHEAWITEASKKIDVPFEV